MDEFSKKYSTFLEKYFFRYSLQMLNICFIYMLNYGLLRNSGLDNLKQVAYISSFVSMSVLVILSSLKLRRALAKCVIHVYRRIECKQISYVQKQNKYIINVKNLCISAISQIFTPMITVLYYFHFALIFSFKLLEIGLINGLDINNSGIIDVQQAMEFSLVILISLDRVFKSYITEKKLYAERDITLNELCNQNIEHESIQSTD